MPAGPLMKTLPEFGSEADVQMVFDPRQVAGTHYVTSEVVGQLRIEEAMRRLLEGIPATYMCVDPATIAVTVTARRHWWQSPPDPLERVTVTAGNDSPLSVASRSGSPLLSFELQDIRQSGATSLAEFLKAIPQVWGGGPTDHTSLGREAVMNPGGATGINLRAMDAGAALVLVDGIRLSPAGAAEYTDIGAIPLSSIERIDIAADGPSALYGADAVSGVVNIVTRQALSGAEFSSSAGSAVGGARQTAVSQLFGDKGTYGNWVLSGEYYDREALPASARGRATSDLRAWGGSDFRTPYGSPGTVVGAQGQTWAVPKTGGPTFEPGANLYDEWSNVDILPQQRRGSLMAHGTVHIDDAFTVWADGLVSDRRMQKNTNPGYPATLVVPETNPYYVDPTGVGGPVILEYGFGNLLGPLAAHTETFTGMAALGAEMHSDTWRFRSQFSYSRQSVLQDVENAVDRRSLAAALSSTDLASAFNPFADTPENSEIARSLRTTLRYRSATAQMDLLSYAQRPIGPRQADDGSALVTVGAEYRRQTLHSSSPGSVPDGQRDDLGRSVTSAFAEVTSPIGRDIALSAGARYENHGTERVLSPKFALRWSPLPLLSVRSTWGRSYRDPNLTDRVEANNSIEIITLPDSHASNGASNVLVDFGNNAALHAERARNWTAGLDLAAGERGSLSATYFDIASAGRIYSPTLTASALADPSFDGLIVRKPSYAQRLAVCQAPGVYLGDPASCMAVPIAAIVDVRLQNLDVLRERGIDVTGHRDFESIRFGKFSVGLNSSYLLDYSIRHGPGEVPVSLLNTEDRPVDFRARGFVAWSRRTWGANVAVNYTGPYRNFGSLERTGVGSWTTLDLQVSRRFSAGPVAYELSLNALNVFNTLSPFVDNSLGGYDPENGDYTGRMLSATVRASW